MQFNGPFSRWLQRNIKLDGCPFGRWYPTGSQGATADCVVATTFRFGGETVDASVDGLSPEWFHLLAAKFPGLLHPVDGDAHVFHLPLVPPGSLPIDIDLGLDSNDDQPPDSVDPE